MKGFDFDRLKHFAFLRIDLCHSKDIEYRSIFNWAVIKCTDEIRISDDSPIAVCERFIKQMEDYAFRFEDPDIRWSWFVAKEGGEYVLDQFIEAQEEAWYRIEHVRRRFKERRNKLRETT